MSTLYQNRIQDLSLFTGQLTTIADTVTCILAMARARDVCRAIRAAGSGVARVSTA